MVNTLILSATSTNWSDSDTDDDEISKDVAEELELALIRLE